MLTVLLDSKKDGKNNHRNHCSGGLKIRSAFNNIFIKGKGRMIFISADHIEETNFRPAIVDGMM
jgi:hypothetical protein